MAAENNPWSEWVRQTAKPSLTAKLSKVESRVLDNRTWWDDYGAELSVWFQMVLLRVAFLAILCFIAAAWSAFDRDAGLVCTKPAGGWEYACVYHE